MRAPIATWPQCQRANLSAKGSLVSGLVFGRLDELSGPRADIEFADIGASISRPLGWCFGSTFDVRCSRTNQRTNKRLRALVGSHSACKRWAPSGPVWLLKRKQSRRPADWRSVRSRSTWFLVPESESGRFHRARVFWLAKTGSEQCWLRQRSAAFSIWPPLAWLPAWLSTHSCWPPVEWFARTPVRGTQRTGAGHKRASRSQIWFSRSFLYLVQCLNRALARFFRPFKAPLQPAI